MTRQFRLTKKQSDEFCKTVKDILKKLKVSQTRLGVIAGYSRQTICTVLHRREETVCRSQYMSIISALSFLIVNSELDDDTKAEAFGMLRSIGGRFIETF